MTLSFHKTSKGVNWLDVAAIFYSVGWGERNPKDIESAFSQSSCVRFVYDSDRLIGFGRTVDDGKYYAMVADLVIDSQYQGNGIGTRLLKEIQESMNGYQFLTLTSAVGKDKFYEKQNWKRQTSAFIWPNSEKQKNDHAKGS